MSATSVTLAGRRAAENLMVERCTIREYSPAAFVDGTYVPGAGAVVYSGRCEIQVTDSLNAETPTVGEREVTLQRVTLKVPISTTGIQVGHIAVIDSASLDPDLEGRPYRIEAHHAKSFATARRLQCEEITG